MDNRIVILTGAGVSAESGLGTFRDKGGIWTKYDLSEVATPEGFQRDPGKVHDFYNARRQNCAQASPNAAHAALARLEERHTSDVLIVTQNVDDLHERAGSRRVIHMHGRLMRALCAACGETWDAPVVMSPEDACPHCQAQATRPDIVWFGEMPYQMDEIYEALGAADLFVSIGTSGQVYPAAGFVQEARLAGIRTLELNLEPSDGTSAFDEVRHGPATDIIPAWVKDVL